MRLVYGVGINDADYEISPVKDGKPVMCPFYRVWTSMLKRVFSEKCHVEFPPYRDCTLHHEWVYFTKFKSWMETKNWQGNELDKDLLIKGNKEYGPDTCLFVSKKINMFIVGNEAIQRDLPKGVTYDSKSNKFRARGRYLNGVQKHIGCFDTEQEASSAYIDFKIERAKELAELTDDPEVKLALINYYAR